jgi:hypothetical protein
MSALYIRLKFDRQEGNNYYFLAGFFNEGIDLSPSMGNFPSQHTVLDVVGQVPISLQQGTFVGTYEIPVDMTLSGIKGTPWIWDVDLLPDLLTNWYEIIGFLYLDWYECLYQPADTPLPEPYASKEPTALSHPTLNDRYNLPLLPGQWPSSPAEYETQVIADSVSLEGCQLMGEWASAWNNPNEWHMLTLIGTQPKLPQEPDILTRWRSLHAASGMKRSEGSYNSISPQYDFRGWASPFSNNGKIEILQGVSSGFGDTIVTSGSGVIIPYLSPSKSGDQVSLQIPKALTSSPAEDNQAFIFPGAAAEPPDGGIVAPVYGALLPLLYFFFMSATVSPGQVFLDNFRMVGKDTPGYGAADETHPAADETHPAAEQEK